MARVFNVTFAARNPIELARFWSEVTGQPVEGANPDRARVAGSPGLLFMRVDDPAPRSRVHIDVAAADPEAELDRLLALGATPADPMRRSGNGIDWITLHDPEGNELCLGADPD